MRAGWLVLATACSFHHGTTQASGDAPADTTDAPGDAAAPAGRCAALAVTGTIVSVATVGDLRLAIQNATSGTTIELADGVYDVSGGTLVIGTPNVVVRGASGDASKVTLDGMLVVNPLIRIAASNVTLTQLSLVNASGGALVINPTASGDITGDVVHDVTFTDNEGAAIRVAPNNGSTTGPFADGGTISCSHFSETIGNTGVCSAGTLGIAMESARGWTIRDNHFTNVRCPNQLQRAMFIRYGARDIAVVRNTILGSSINIGLGDGNPTNTAPARTYSDAVPAVCGAAIPNFWGGVACDNVIDGLNVPIFQGNGSFDSGISGWTACDTWILHNTVVSPAGNDTFTSFEYRFIGSYVHFVNNLSLKTPTQRDTGMEDLAYAASNVTYASPTDFVDATSGDLHLAAGSPETAGVSIATLGLCDRDADDKPRNTAAPMVGAYER